MKSFVSAVSRSKCEKSLLIWSHSIQYCKTNTTTTTSATKTPEVQIALNGAQILEYRQNVLKSGIISKHTHEITLWSLTEQFAFMCVQVFKIWTRKSFDWIVTLVEEYYIVRIEFSKQQLSQGKKKKRVNHTASEAPGLKLDILLLCTLLDRQPHNNEKKKK